MATYEPFQTRFLRSRKFLRVSPPPAGFTPAAVPIAALTKSRTFYREGWRKRLDVPVPGLFPATPPAPAAYKLLNVLRREGWRKLQTPLTQPDFPTTPLPPAIEDRPVNGGFTTRFIPSRRFKSSPPVPSFIVVQPVPVHPGAWLQKVTKAKARVESGRAATIEIYGVIIPITPQPEPSWRAKKPFVRPPFIERKARSFPPVLRKLNKTIGVAAELDSALGLGKRKQKVLGLSTEVDSALSLTATTYGAVGISVETDSALTLDKIKIRALSYSLEEDSAYALSTAFGSGLEAVEYDSAFALGGVKLGTYTFSSEIDTDLALTVAKVSLCGLSASAEIALPSTGTKIPDYGIVRETDISIALIRKGEGEVGRAKERDRALSLRVKKKTRWTEETVGGNTWAQESVSGAAWTEESASTSTWTEEEV